MFDFEVSHAKMMMPDRKLRVRWSSRYSVSIGLWMGASCTVHDDMHKCGYVITHAYIQTHTHTYIYIYIYNYIYIYIHMHM